MILDDSSSTWSVTEIDSDSPIPEPAPLPPASPVDSVDDGIPTGNLIVEAKPEPEPRALALQTAIVAGAALLVGLLVFFVVRAIVSSDSSEDAAPDPVDDVAIIEPGPATEDEVATENSSRSGDRRDSDDGLAESSPFDANADGEAGTENASDEGPTGPAPVAAGNDSASGGEDSATEQPDANDNRSTGQMETPANPTTTSPTGASTSAGGSPLTTAASATTAAPTSANQTTTPPTTATPTTEAPAPTTAPTTTTTAPSTTQAPPPLPTQLIALPSDGSRRLWETFTRFRAAEVPGAARYCWGFGSAGGKREECSSNVVYDLPANPDGLSPGPITVEATAYDAGGAVLLQQRIGIQLLVGNLVQDPDNGDTFDRNDRLRLRSRSVPTADNYCWTLTQGSVSTGRLCDSDGRDRLRVRSLRSDGFRSGPVSVRATAFRSSALIADQTISITLE